MRPIIGITTSVHTLDHETQGQDIVMVPSNYPEAIRRAGGMPILIEEGEVDKSVLNLLDGVLLTGGRDINPELYGQQPHERTCDVRQKQDTSEISLIRATLKRDLPFLGICRGHQLFCVYNGGKLHQHLPETSGFENHGATEGQWSMPEISIQEGSTLASIIGTKIIGNSGHHQGVANAGNLHVTGRTGDGLIEAVENPAKRFCMSVQWHPEMIGQHESFEAFIRAAQG